MQRDGCRQYATKFRLPFRHLLRAGRISRIPRQRKEFTSTQALGVSIKLMAFTPVAVSSGNKVTFHHAQYAIQEN